MVYAKLNNIPCFGYVEDTELYFYVRFIMAFRRIILVRVLHSYIQEQYYSLTCYF